MHDQAFLILLAQSFVFPTKFYPPTAILTNRRSSVC